MGMNIKKSDNQNTRNEFISFFLFIQLKSEMLKDLMLKNIIYQKV